LFTFTEDQVESGRYKEHIEKAFVKEEDVSVPEVSV